MNCLHQQAGICEYCMIVLREAQKMAFQSDIDIAALQQDKASNE